MQQTESRKKRLIVFSIFILLGISLFFLFKKPESKLFPDSPLEKKDSLVTSSLLNMFFDFENADGNTSEKYFSGNKSYKMDNTMEYGFGIKKKANEISNYSIPEGVNVDFKFLMPDSASVLYVLSIDDNNNKNVYWEGKPLVCNDKKNWNSVSFSFNIKPEYINPENTINIYFWNRDKKEFYVDDLSVDYIGKKSVVPAALNMESLNLFFDLETMNGLSGTENIKEGIAHSGKFSANLSNGTEYGPLLSKPATELLNDYFKKISFSAWIYPLTDNHEVVLTASGFNQNNETVFWQGKSTDHKNFPKNKWTKLNAVFPVPLEKLNKNDKIQVMVWNKGKTDVLVDDLEIVFGEETEKRTVSETMNTSDQKNYLLKPLFFIKQQAAIPFLNELNPNDDYLAGDFVKDKDALDEFICLKEKRAMLYSYNHEKKSFQQIWASSGNNEILADAKAKKYAGDFNNDGTCDLLIINTQTGEWELLDFKNQKWESVLKGNNKIDKKWFDNNVFTTRTFSSNKADALVLLDKNNFILLRLANKILEEKNIGSVHGINPDDKIYPVDFDDNPDNEFLKLNTSWRFDLKLGEVQQNNFNATNAIDFRGYEKDFNPKYYEFTKIVAGNFTDKKKSSLIVISYNCADANFNGTHCNAFENLNYLPNTIALYTTDIK